MGASSQPFKVLAVDDSAISRGLVEQSLPEERYAVLLRRMATTPLICSENTNLPWLLQIGTCRAWEVWKYASVYVATSQIAAAISSCSQATARKSKYGGLFPQERVSQQPNSVLTQVPECRAGLKAMGITVVTERYTLSGPGPSGRKPPSGQQDVSTLPLTVFRIFGTRFRESVIPIVGVIDIA
jgi:hypothetical protein